MTDKRLPRGVRLSNPGNLRHGKSEWRGMSEVQDDSDFVRFEAPEWGLRAIVRLLRNYYTKYGLRSIEAMIFRYAPPEDNNDTRAYVRTVASKLGIDPQDPVDIDDPVIMTALVKAIVRVEQGRGPLPDQGWYEDDVILKAIELA